MLVPAQVRAARALLDWSAKELAKRAGVSPRTVQRIETSRDVLHMHTRTIEKISRALRKAGVKFIEDDKRIGVVLEADPGSP